MGDSGLCCICVRVTVGDSGLCCVCVRVTVGDSGLCWVCVTSFERYQLLLFVDSSQTMICSIRGKVLNNSLKDFVLKFADDFMWIFRL